MNIQQVIENLENTIQAKEEMLSVLVDTVVDSPGPRADLEIVAQVLVDSIRELNAILADCQRVRDELVLRSI